MSWNHLTELSQLDTILRNSASRPQLIYKHSTRCGLSGTAKFHIESEMAELSRRFDLHYLDLLSHRDISNEIAARLEVPHASPQVIVVVNGKAIFDLSHALVTPRFILDYADREIAAA